MLELKFAIYRRAAEVCLHMQQAFVVIVSLAPGTGTIDSGIILAALAEESLIQASIVKHRVHPSLDSQLSLSKTWDICIPMWHERRDHITMLLTLLTLSSFTSNIKGNYNFLTHPEPVGSQRQTFTIIHTSLLLSCV